MGEIHLEKECVMCKEKSNHIDFKKELAFELAEFFSELTPPSTKENLVFLLDAINSRIILKYIDDKNKIKLSKIALKLISEF